MFIRDLFLTIKKYVHFCLRDVWSLFRELYFAKKHGLAFISGYLEDQPQAGLRGDAKQYEGSHFLRFSEVIDSLELSAGDVFVDIGCGKGRALSLAMLKKPRKVVGVELVEEYAAVARKIVRPLAARFRVPFEIRNSDAATARIDDGTVYYLFNPFGADTLRAVLENIKAGLTANPRRIRIVYMMPRHERVLAESGWLKKVYQFDGTGSFGGDLAAAVWQNVPG